ncbi:MAG: FAD:protein FMN transferase [Methylomonas sp.]|jgi:thiamine biosynthesis lipoprotein
MNPNKLKLYRYPFKAMGTLCELQLYSEHPGKTNRFSKRVIADVHRLEAKYSRYRPDSLLSGINRTALEGGAVEVDDETAVLLDYADTCYRQSDGLFDITSGVLRRAWRFDSGRLPDAGEIRRLLDIVGWRKLNWRSPLLEFGQAGMELDFGGVVKEYAVDRAAALCREAGFRHGLVNLGGDIRLVGPRPGDLPWGVGVAHPRRKGAVWLNIDMRAGAMACSGDYERCIVIDGVRYAHVLNPKTGWPARYLAAVTVLGDFCVVAGSATTIAMLKEEEGPAWLDELGLPHAWMDVNGREGGSI